MARGQQKIQSQQKNAEKQAKMKKAQGADQKKAAKAALVFTCSVCKVSIHLLTCVSCKSITVILQITCLWDELSIMDLI